MENQLADLQKVQAELAEARIEIRALRESESRYRLVAEMANDLLWDWDLVSGQMIRNEGIERLFGYTAAEIGTDPSWGEANLHPDDKERVLSGIRAALAGDAELWEDEYRYRRAGGDYAEVYSRGRILRDAGGRALRLVGSMSDVTGRRQAEKELRRQSERLWLLWEAASVLLITDEPEVIIRDLFDKIAPHFGLDAYFSFRVDDSGEALRLESCTGISEETARSISRLEFGQAVCGTVALHRRPLMATFIQGSDDPKVQLVKSLGIRAYACNPLIADGRLLGTLSFASRSRDQLEPDELEFLQTVTYYVMVAYERLRLVRELQEAGRRKDEFLATLAHELRNPLAPIRSGLQILGRVWRNPGVPAAHEAVEQAQAMMDRQLRQMVRLVDDLLDVSRISRGQIELRRERLDLAAVVQSAVESNRPRIEQSGQELSIRLPAEPVRVEADPTRLAQVFSNLLDNAAKYTGRGGHILISAERQGGEAVVAVRDDGIGIPPSMLSRVFEMFTQIDRSLERSQSGLGIGLSISRRLVEMHGGTIEARSGGDGQGSEFVVRLPRLAAAEEPAASGTETAGPAPAARRRILLADDNADAASSLAMLLEMLGNEVRTAGDGLEALAAAETFRPEVVLLDIGMPHLNGYETCRRLRQQPGGGDLRILALTGWGQDEDKRRSREAGFDHHLVKPVELAVLEKLLEPAELKPA